MVINDVTGGAACLAAGSVGAVRPTTEAFEETVCTLLLLVDWEVVSVDGAVCGGAFVAEYCESGDVINFCAVAGDTTSGDVTGFWDVGGSLTDVETACVVVGETAGVACFVKFVAETG